MSLRAKMSALQLLKAHFKDTDFACSYGLTVKTARNMKFWPYACLTVHEWEGQFWRCSTLVDRKTYNANKNIQKLQNVSTWLWSDVRCHGNIFAPVLPSLVTHPALLPPLLLAEHPLNPCFLRSFSFATIHF